MSPCERQELRAVLDYGSMEKQYNIAVIILDVLYNST